MRKGGRQDPASTKYIVPHKAGERRKRGRKKKVVPY